MISDLCFAPANDMGNELIKSKMDLFSLEFKKPLKDFNIVGFTIQYELSYTNILYMLELSGIEINSDKRREKISSHNSGRTLC